MKLFVSYAADKIELMLGRASLADNPEEISRISQAIERGNRLWTSWAESHGGKVINSGGDEGRLEIEADYLSELPGIREQYEGATGSTCSVGVGTKLSEADRSLMAAKLQGGDRITLYTEEVDEILAKVKEKSEAEKLQDEYLDPDEGLKKADPAMNAGANAGFAGASRSTPAAPQKPTEGSEHSENEALQTQIANAPAPAEAPQAAADYEQLFHQLASAQKEEPAGKPSGVVDGVREQVVKVLQQVKGHAQELEQMRQSNPELYQSVVGVVQAMITMARGSLGGGQPEVQKSELKKGDVVDLKPPPSDGKKRRRNAEVVPLATPANTVWDAPGSPEHGKVLDPEARKRARQGAVPNFEEPKLAVRGIGRGKNVYDYSHFLSPEARQAGSSLTIQHLPGQFDDGMLAELRDSGGQVQQKAFAYPLSMTPSKDPQQAELWRALTNHGNWAQFGQVQKSEDKIEMDPAESPAESKVLSKDLLPGGAADGKSPMEFDEAQLKEGVAHEMEHTKDERIATEIAMDHLTEDPQYYQKLKTIEKDALDKAALEAGKTGRHQVVLPVGSQIDAGPSAAHESGELKVRDPETGKTKWRSVRAGIVMAPDGTPTSSRNPSGS